MSSSINSCFMMLQSNLLNVNVAMHGHLPVLAIFGLTADVIHFSAGQSWRKRFCFQNRYFCLQKLWIVYICMCD